MDSLRRASILLVDDNTNNLGVLYNYLDTEGFTVLVSQDAERGIELAKNERPDLILLDVLLPGMSGFEACGKIKSDPRTADIPVIFISALTEIEDKVRGFEAGGVDYITKPFQHEEVLARIAAHLTIKKQREELNRLNATKDRFFSIIAHDLRGPFMGLLGALELLRDSTDSMDAEETRQLVDNLYGSAHKTYLLLENLLEWSRSQQNAVEYKPTELIPAAVIREAVQLFEPAARQKSIGIVVKADPDTKVVADKDMLSTVLRNLVNNAIKFTNHGGTITISTAPEGNHVALSITDTGVGMSDEVRDNLFRIDIAASRAGTAGERGSGLGLLLARDYVRKHGSDISVESRSGTGSTFRFTLPAQDK